MYDFQTRAMLQTSGLFNFNADANRLLSEYSLTFTADGAERQFRLNTAVVGAAEFAYWREVLSSGLPTRDVDVRSRETQLSIATTDTLRLRPCRSAVRAATGELQSSDLTMLTGEALKMDDPSLPNANDDISFFEKLALSRFSGFDEDWLKNKLPDVGFARYPDYMSVFAWLRFAAFRNIDAEAAGETFTRLLQNRGLAPAAAAG